MLNSKVLCFSISVKNHRLQVILETVLIRIAITAPLTFPFKENRLYFCKNSHLLCYFLQDMEKLSTIQQKFTNNLFYHYNNKCLVAQVRYIVRFKMVTFLLHLLIKKQIALHNKRWLFRSYKSNNLICFELRSCT